MLDILIADDHPLALLGIQTFLEQKGYHICSSCDNGLEAYNQIVTRQPAIAMMDVNMPGLNGLEVIQKIIQKKIPTKLVLLTMQNELSVFNRAVELGIKGYLLKEFATAEVEKCLFEVGNGRTYFSVHLNDGLVMNNHAASNSEIDRLTFAEKKILELVAQQKSTREIAVFLFISEKTVETHRGNIIKKLNIPHNKNALLMWAMKNIQ